MRKHPVQTRQADAKGRITLGPAFAHRVVLVEEREDGFVVTPARVIPENEAWLYEDPRALKLLRSGLDEARKRKFAKGPDLTAAAKLADKIQDE